MRKKNQARGERRPRRRRDPARLLLSAVMLFFFSAFLLLALGQQPLNWQPFALAVCVPALIYVTVMGLPRLFPTDKLLLSLTSFLCALGVLVLYRLSPERGITQAVNYGVGVACMLACVLLVRYIKRWKWLTALIALGSLGLLCLPLVMGTEIYGAKNWVTLGGVSVQPSEIVKLSLLIVLAYWMSRRRLFPWLAFAGACLCVLMLQKDLGTALLYYGTALCMLYAATGSLALTGIGVAGGAGAAVLGYQMFAHVKRRVALWQNPWASYDGDGYQIVHALIAMASGGLLGMGLGLGNPTVIPAYWTDFIFAVIVEQFGLLFGLCVLLIYVALTLRGISIALGARTAFDALLATGCTAMIALQTFVIIAGNIKLIPLTGVTLPFVSYGGTSLVSSLCIIGLLQGVASRNDDALAEDRRLAAFSAQAEP